MDAEGGRCRQAALLEYCERKEHFGANVRWQAHRRCRIYFLVEVYLETIKLEERGGLRR